MPLLPLVEITALFVCLVELAPAAFLFPDFGGALGLRSDLLEAMMAL